MKWLPSGSVGAPERRRRRTGFTLVELVLSASVMAGILAGAYLCLQAGLRGRAISASRMDLLQNARVAMAHLGADLRSACPLSEEFEFVGMDRELDGREADNLDFATHNYSPRAPGEGDFCEVSYFVDRNRETGELGLWRRRDPSPDGEPLAGGSKEEIAVGVSSFNLEYYDGFTWNDEWGKTHGAAPGGASTAKASAGGEPTGRGKPGEPREEPLFRSNLFGLPDAVRITLVFAERAPPSRTAGPGAPFDSASAALDADRRDPPLLLQTVVHLNLARRLETAASGSETEGISTGSGSGGQKKAGGKQR